MFFRLVREVHLFVEQERKKTIMTTKEDFTPTVPTAIRDFVFDLHECVRRSLRLEDVQRLYETKLKEITDGYFGNSTWPEAKVIANEVNNDELFLALYT